MSDIQRSIISRLKNADSLRYAQLKPNADIPNDLYNYHLKKLIQDGLVVKHPDNTYGLSQQGLRHVADVHHTSDQSDRLFKMNALLIVTKQTPDDLFVLNQLRTSQPSYGIRGIPGGTILKSEPLLDGASRKLYEETGLTGTFELIGIERRILNRDNKLFSDVIFPLCYCKKSSGQLQDTEYGKNEWVSIETAIRNDSRADDRIESIPKVLEAIQSNTINDIRGFYHEQIVT